MVDKYNKTVYNINLLCDYVWSHTLQ